MSKRACFAIVLVALAGLPALSWAAGGKLVLAKDRDPEVYDPQRTTAISAGAVASMLYDTLVYLDYDLKTITPGLAKSWTIAADGKTYAFQLRTDVTFHSGRKLTAADVKFTFDRLLDPKTASPSKFRLAEVESVEVAGDAAAIIRLSSPRSDLLLQLTHPFLGIIDREAVEKLGPKYGTAGAGGTGPFSFVEWVSNDRMVLKRHDAYRWGPPFYKNRGPAHVEEVVIRTIPEPQTIVFELERGNVHAVYPVRPSDIDVLRKNKDVRILEARPNQQIQYLGFKITRPGVSDPVVRRAISASINKDEIVKEIQRGQGSVARGMFLPGTRDYWGGQEAIFPRYSPQQAKAWLDAAGWKPGADGIRAKEGQQLSLTFLSWVPEQEELATVLQAQLKAVGIGVQVKQMAISAYFPALRRADHEMWSLDTPYPSILELLNFWFWSGNIPSPNRFNWNDKRTDELLATARTARTDEARAKALQEIQRIMSENYLAVPIWHRALIVAARVELKDFRPHGIYSSGFYKLLDAKLEK